MRFRKGDLVRIVEDPESHIISDELIDKLAIVISIDEAQKIYTVVVNETNKKTRLLYFMIRHVETIKKVE